MQVISLQERVAAPAARVFRAWEDPTDLHEWAWGTLSRDAAASVDFEVGGDFSVSTARPDGRRWAFSGKYLEIESGRRLSHTLSWDAPMGYEPVDEVVTVTFQDAGDATIIVFEHAAAISEASAEGHREGWKDVLGTLKRYLERAASPLEMPPGPIGESPADPVSS
jgi:uncharacterized protein YndB with AHSA1/START domain